MLKPSQFKVNEAWIIFRLNGAPISTEADGDFNVLCLMDAASCYILGDEFVLAHLDETPESAVAKLIETGRSRAHVLPPKILVSAELDTGGVATVAEPMGLEVVSTAEKELLPIVSEARASFRAYIEGGRMH